MLVKTFGSAVYGVEAITISVEVNVMSGKEYFIVGLPDNAVKESLKRVESTIKTNGFMMPRTKLVVNLAPADIRKSGSAFDLAIAVATLGASEQLDNPERLADYMIMGELNLDGTVQPIKGALPIAITARKDGFKGLILPKQNCREAGMVNNLNVFGVGHFMEVVDFFRDETCLDPVIVNTRDEFLFAQCDFDSTFNSFKTFFHCIIRESDNEIFFPAHYIHFYRNSYGFNAIDSAAKGFYQHNFGIDASEGLRNLS